MRDVIEKFKRLIAKAVPQLAKIKEKESEHRPAPGKWSKKEILGHLIDSASNNHQRFVRAQAASELRFPGYAQESWVSFQAYQEESWKSLVNLWVSYNIHLLHVVSSIPQDKLNHRCTLDNKEPVTLGSLVSDYVRHAEHHLEQILGRTV